MELRKIESTLRMKNYRAINNSTDLGTYSIVSCDKFFTKGVNNRDNARWKRAQFIIVTDCPESNIRSCLEGFFAFSERCQYVIFSQTNTVYNGLGKRFSFSEFINSI